MRTLLASMALAAVVLVAPFSANAAFTIKIFADPFEADTGIDFGNQIGEFTSEVIAFGSNDVETSNPGWPLATERFGVEVTGYLNTDSDGDFPLYLGSDDGAFLFVNGILVIARPGDQSFGESQADVSLAAGSTPFRIAYYNGPCCDTGLTLAADDRVTISAAPIPEPGTYALMAGGLVAVAAGARNRRRRQIG